MEGGKENGRRGAPRERSFSPARVPRAFRVFFHNHHLPSPGSSAALLLAVAGVPLYLPLIQTHKQRPQACSSSPPSPSRSQGGACVPWSMHATMLLAAATWRRATPASGARRGERAVCASSGSCWWVLRGVVACALAEARVFAEALLAGRMRVQQRELAHENVAFVGLRDEHAQISRVRVSVKQRQLRRLHVFRRQWEPFLVKMACVRSDDVCQQGSRG